MTSDVCDKKTLGWFSAYPEKQQASCDLKETVDMAAEPIIATKQPITPSIPIAKG